MPTTSRFTNILVPLEGSTISEQALALAAALAGPSTTVTLLHVDVPSGHTPPAMLETVVAAQTGAVPIADEAQAAELTQTSERWTSQFAGPMHSSVIFGDPVTEILRAADQTGADLIVCATHRRGILGRWAFGSVTDDISRHAKVPVLVVRAHGDDVPAKAATVGRIVVPYDGSDLSRAALPTALGLAKDLNVPVHVVTAYEPSPVAPISTGIDIAYPLGGYIELQAELEKIAKEDAESALKYFQDAGVDVTGNVHIGPAARAIEDDLNEGDLIVITSHGRGGLERALLGSVADKLIRDGKAPTLVIPAAARGADSPGAKA